MCEFRVLIDGETVFEDVIYARDEGGRILLKDILGESKVFENCKIVEVDVGSTRLILARRNY